MLVDEEGGGRVIDDEDKIVEALFDELVEENGENVESSWFGTPWSKNEIIEGSLLQDGAPKMPTINIGAMTDESDEDEECINELILELSEETNKEAAPIIPFTNASENMKSSPHTIFSANDALKIQGKAEKLLPNNATAFIVTPRSTKQQQNATSPTSSAAALLEEENKTCSDNEEEAYEELWLPGADLMAMTPPQQEIPPKFDNVTAISEKEVALEGLIETEIEEILPPGKNSIMKDITTESGHEEGEIKDKEYVQKKKPLETLSSEEQHTIATRPTSTKKGAREDFQERLREQEDEFKRLQMQLEAARLEGERLKALAENESSEVSNVEVGPEAPSTAELFAMVEEEAFEEQVCSPQVLEDRSSMGIPIDAIPQSYRKSFGPVVPSAAELFPCSSQPPTKKEQDIPPTYPQHNTIPSVSPAPPVLPSPSPQTSPAGSFAQSRQTSPSGGIAQSPQTTHVAVQLNPERRNVPTSSPHIQKGSLCRNSAGILGVRPAQNIFNQSQSNASSFFTHAVPQTYFEQEESSIIPQDLVQSPCQQQTFRNRRWSIGSPRHQLEMPDASYHENNMETTEPIRIERKESRSRRFSLDSIPAQPWRQSRSSQGAPQNQSQRSNFVPVEQMAPIGQRQTAPFSTKAPIPWRHSIPNAPSTVPAKMSKPAFFEMAPAPIKKTECALPLPPTTIPSSRQTIVIEEEESAPRTQLSWKPSTQMRIVQPPKTQRQTRADACCIDMPVEPMTAPASLKATPFFSTPLPTTVVPNTLDTSSTSFCRGDSILFAGNPPSTSAIRMAPPSPPAQIEYAAPYSIEEQTPDTLL